MSCDAEQIHQASVVLKHLFGSPNFPVHINLFMEGEKESPRERSLSKKTREREDEGEKERKMSERK